MNRRARICGAAVLACLFCTSLATALGWPSEAAEIGRGLSSQESSERARAAGRLLTLSPSSAQSLVELALEDEDDAVRMAGARAAIVHGLAGLGEHVLGWLKDPSPDLRAAALRVLTIDLDARHVPAVVRSTLDPDERVRSSAVRCLGRARLALGPEVTSGLVVALDDASPLVRVDATVGLGRLGDASATSALVARLSDAEESVRRGAAVALGSLGDRRATSALSFALEDRSVAVAAASAQSLGALGDPAAEPALERALLEPGWGPLQVASAEALAELDQRRGWDALLVRLAEQDAAPSIRGLFRNASALAKESIAECLLHSGGLALLECARIANQAQLPLDALLGRVRRGGLPTAKLFQVATPTTDVELLVLAIERLARGTIAERQAALQLLDQSAPLPRETGGLLGEALTVPGLASRDVAGLLLLLGPSDVDAKTLSQLTHASDPLVSASARALRALSPPPGTSVLGPLDASPLEASVYGRLLSRGMDRALSERFIREVGARGAPLSPPVLQALLGVPADLSPASVQQLSALVRAERGESREFLLPVLASQRAAGPHLEAFFARGSVQDRRSLAALFLHRPGLAKLAVSALSDADPWVRAQAAQGASASAVERLLGLVRGEEPAFVRTSALVALARLAPKRAVDTLRACDLLDAPELGVRVGALRLLDRAGASCPSRPFEDIVLLEREPLLREIAARALRRRDAGHRALRSCRTYDAEQAVAQACAGKGADPAVPPAVRLAFVEIVPAWLDEPAPSCPYALVDSAGELFLGITDRRGQAPVPGAGVGRVLDPRIAL